MELHENALLALDTIHQKPTKGIPSCFILPMEHRIIDRLAGVPERTYNNKPIETYLRMQKNIGICTIDQWIPTNPLSMGVHGYYEPGTRKTATTGQEQIVMDEMVGRSGTQDRALSGRQQFNRPRRADGEHEGSCGRTSVLPSARKELVYKNKCPIHVGVVGLGRGSSFPGDAAKTFGICSELCAQSMEKNGI